MGETLFFLTLLWLSVAPTGFAASAKLFAVNYPIVAYVANSVLLPVQP
jgi:hypothetical protein